MAEVYYEETRGSLRDNYRSSELIMYDTYQDKEIVSLKNFKINYFLNNYINVFMREIMRRFKAKIIVLKDDQIRN